MGFQIIGSHSFRVLLGDPNCLCSIGYGNIVLMRRLDLQIEVCKVPIMMKFKPLLLMQEEEEEEEEVSADHSKEESLE